MEKRTKPSTTAHVVSGIKATMPNSNESAIRKSLEQLNSKLIKRNRIKANKLLIKMKCNPVVDLIERKRLTAFINAATAVLAARGHE